MDLFTSLLHFLTSGASAYFTAHQMRYSLTRPHLLAGFQLAESGSVPFLESLSARAATEGDTWLAEKLALHAADESRHGQIFAHSLKQLNKQVVDFKNLPKKPENNSSESKKRSSFFDTYFDGYSATELKAENIDWLVFMGSTYILELDASKDFLLMAKALKDEDKIERNIKAGITSIAEDETRHAAYLLEAMERRFPTAVTQDTVERWRERKVKALITMVGNLLEKSGNTPSLAEDIESKPKSIATETLVATV